MNETKPQLLVFKGRPVSPKPGWICRGFHRLRWEAKVGHCSVTYLSLTQAKGITPPAPSHTSLSPGVGPLGLGFGTGRRTACQLWAKTRSTVSW